MSHVFFETVCTLNSSIESWDHVHSRETSVELITFIVFFSTFPCKSTESNICFIKQDIRPNTYKKAWMWMTQTILLFHSPPTLERDKLDSWYDENWWNKLKIMKQLLKSTFSQGHFLGEIIDFVVWMKMKAKCLKNSGKT